MLNRYIANQNYTIPKINRELKQRVSDFDKFINYTIPKINRELKLCLGHSQIPPDYTIPKINRELKRLF